MAIQYFHINAFCTEPLNGNPAGVCILNEPLSEELMQSIALENNFSATAFLRSKNGEQHLRWFSTTAELPLCGHATLATAYVLMDLMKAVESSVVFKTKAGDLSVERADGGFAMNFPAEFVEDCEVPEALLEGLGHESVEVKGGMDYLVRYNSEAEIRDILPRLDCLQKLDRRGVIITAPGDNVDFVSRFFCPKLGISEDPVTGSAHCLLAPYWSQELDKEELVACQLSARGGGLRCSHRGDRVILTGAATKFLEGKLPSPLEL